MYQSKPCKFLIPVPPVRRDTGPRIPSLGIEYQLPLTKQIGKKITYEGEMAEREKIARKEIERKKLRIAPLYNKGGYQYITPETDLKTIGRKI